MLLVFVTEVKAGFSGVRMHRAPSWGRAVPPLGSASSLKLCINAHFVSGKLPLLLQHFHTLEVQKEYLIPVRCHLYPEL